MLDIFGSIPNRRTRFPSPPSGTYAVFFDDADTSPGADLCNNLVEHDVTVELYESAPDDAAEQLIESNLDALNIKYQKQDRYWLQDVQRYQVIYTFSFYSK